MANTNECLGITSLTGCLQYNGNTLSTDNCDLIICKGTNLNTILEDIHTQICTALSGCKVKISEDDDCCDYLQTKLTSTDLSLTFTKNTVTDEDGASCETLNIKANFPVETLTWVDLIAPSGLSIAGRFQYSKDLLGTVRIRGSLIAPSIATTTVSLGTLPAGFYDAFGDSTSVQWFSGIASGIYALSVTNFGVILADFSTHTLPISQVTLIINMQYNIS